MRHAPFNASVTLERAPLAAEQAIDLARLSRLQPCALPCGLEHLDLLGQAALHWAEVDSVTRSGGARRRQSNAPGGRSVRREVKLTPEQDLALGLHAASMEVTIPRLLVESALSASRGETATERRDLLATLFALQKGLSAVGTNVNQLTRAANATGEIQGELAEALTYLRRTVERIDECLDALSLEAGQR